MTTDKYRAQLMKRFGPELDDVLTGLGLPADVAVAEVPWLCELLDAGGELPLNNVPRTLGVRLRSLIHDSKPGERGEQPGTLPVAVAHLQSDTRRERELVGVRGGTVDNWTLMFRSQIADVVMGVSTVDPAHLRIAGQVLVHDGAQRQFTAVLSSPERADGQRVDEVRMRDAGDAFGRFNFERVPTEELQLVLSDGVNDVVARLDLAEPVVDDNARPAEGESG